MKNILIIWFAIMGAQLFAQTPQFESDDELYVIAYNGLNLREEPTTDSRVVMKLDHGTQVIVLGQDSTIRQIDNRISKWVHVTVAGKVGYLFGGYLSKYSAILVDGEDFDCHSTRALKDYIFGFFENELAVHEGEINYFGDHDKDSYIVNYKHYADGNSLTETTGYEWQNYVFESYDFTLNDVMNVMEYYIAYSHKYCSQFGDTKPAILNPLKNSSGRVTKIKCSYPLAIVAYQVGFKTVIEFEAGY